MNLWKADDASCRHCSIEARRSVVDERKPVAQEIAQQLLERQSPITPVLSRLHLPAGQPLFIHQLGVVDRRRLFRGQTGVPVDPLDSGRVVVERL